MTIKVSSAKQKGRLLQQWVASKISDLLGIAWGGEDNKLIQSRLMGQSGTDVVLRGEAYTRFKYDVECKAQESWHVPEAIAQARQNTAEGREWLVIMKKKREKPIVIIDADHFFYLLSKIGENK